MQLNESKRNINIFHHRFYGILRGMGSAAAWFYRLAKPFSPGGRSAFLEAKSLAREGGKAQQREHLFCSGPTANKLIALTFNDGPNPDVTPQLLKILKVHDVKATFFLIGREALSQVDLARQIISEGHEVGNHTMNHVRCSEEPERELFRQIQDGQDAIRFASGEEARWFRPPFGDFDEAQLHLPFRSGLSTIYWTTKIDQNADDPAHQIVRFFKQGLKPGAIFSLHEKHANILEALEPMIEAAKAAELKPVTLSDMFAAEKPKFR